MSGFTARTGFQYQDLYLMCRVLGMAANALQHAWDKSLADVISLLDK